MFVERAETVSPSLGFFSLRPFYRHGQLGMSFWAFEIELPNRAPFLNFPAIPF